MFDIKNLKYNSDGLIPAIITDAADGAVLMLGYMNAESLGITLEQKKVCFFSRSRQKLWLKGETSGNFLGVVSIKTDCDADTLLISAKPEGPTCHTGARSCFFEDIYEDENAEQAFCLDDLMKLIEGRKTNPKEGSQFIRHAVIIINLLKSIFQQIIVFLFHHIVSVAIGISNVIAISRIKIFHEEIIRIRGAFIIIASFRLIVSVYKHQL